MYPIQKLFRNDLSNPISTDLGGEIDVSFIIATYYFPVFSNCPYILSADHIASPHSSLFDNLKLWEPQSYSLVDLDCRSQIRTFQKLVLTCKSEWSKIYFIMLLFLTESIGPLLLLTQSNVFYINDIISITVNITLYKTDLIFGSSLEVWPWGKGKMLFQVAFFIIIIIIFCPL